MNQGVAEHYSDSDGLADSIAASLRAAGIDLESVTTADLAGVDEFHIRGRVATLELGEAMGLTAGASVLDIGCGLGGAARVLAEGTATNICIMRSGSAPTAVSPNSTSLRLPM